MKSRALTSESLLNLDSYLPRFHRLLYGKYIGSGKVSLEADYLIMCRPPTPPPPWWRRDPERGLHQAEGEGASGIGRSPG